MNPATGSDQDDERRLQRHRGRERPDHREQCRVGELTNAVALRRQVVHRRLPEQPGEVRVTARFEGAAQARRRGPDRGAEQTTQSRVTGAGRHSGRARFRQMTERGAGDERVRTNAWREPARRRMEQAGRARGTDTDRTGRKDHDEAHRVTTGSPNTRSSSSSRPSRRRNAMPRPVSPAATIKVTNPPLER